MKKYAGEIVHRQQSEHGEITVTDRGARRHLYLDSDAIQSAVDLNDPATLQLSYTRAMMSFLLFNPAPQRILVIGLGGGALIHFLRWHFTSALLDVVEQNETVIHVAEKFFRIQPGSNFNIHYEDGYSFINRAASASNHYDTILIDAYNGYGLASSVNSPSFFEGCQHLLTDEGIAVFNFWASSKRSYNEGMKMLHKQFNDYVLLVPVPDKGNVIALASRQRFPKKINTSHMEKARDLQRRYNIEFCQWLRRVKKRHSCSWLTTWLGHH